MEIKPICSIVDCSNAVHSKDMCQSHYRKSRRTEHPQGILCYWEGCESARYCKGMCAAHYQWSRVNGKFTTVKCSIETCQTHQYAKGYCMSHYGILSAYKLKPEVYENMIIEQNGCCSICSFPSKLQVDHNHDTGLVRALLCSNCNTGLGLMREDKKSLLAMITYIEKYE